MIALAFSERRNGKVPGGGMVIWWSMYIVSVRMRGADEYLDLEGARIEGHGA